MKPDELYEFVDGTVDAGDITVYALSTCGFCKRALAFLRKNSITFRYIYFDDLQDEVKSEIREHLMNTFNKTLRFPFLVYNNERCLVGFDEDEWKSLLGIQS
ncbi:MAG: glutaredoxin family protein [Spirochaetes bacterium]|nr:glutaredoxin family protein [Spirochaetota bacterium]